MVLFAFRSLFGHHSEAGVLLDERLVMRLFIWSYLLSRRVNERVTQWERALYLSERA